MFDEHRRRKQVINGDIEKRLDLRFVQIHRKDAIRPSGTHKIRHKLCRNWHTRLVLAVLTSVAIIRHHSGNSSGRRAPERIDHHAQFNEMRIDRRTRRLQDEDICTPNVFANLERHL